GECGGWLETPARPRAVEAEVGERDVHEARVALADLGWRQAVAALALGAEVLDQDVRRVAQREKAMPALGIVEVDRGATLVGVAEEKGQGAIGSGPVAHERRTEAARGAAGRLDLDHAGAQIGEGGAPQTTP